MNITKTRKFWQEVQQDFQSNATISNPFLCDTSKVFHHQWRNNNNFITNYAFIFLNKYPRIKKNCVITDNLLFIYSSKTVLDMPQEWNYEIRKTFLTWINYLQKKMTRQQIEEKIAALKKVMYQNPNNITVIVHCGDKILDLEAQLEETEKPIIYSPPK